MIQGIKVNQELRGIVYQWKKNLLNIALLTNLKADIIKISRLMFIEYGFNNNRDNDYFEIFKNQFSDKEWEKESVELLLHITKHIEKQEFYFRENKLDNLIESLKLDHQYYFQDLNIEPRFLAVLLPDYETEIKKIVLKRANQYLVTNTGTSSHKNVCQTLVSLKKRGVDIEDMKQYFLEKYPNRPSFKNVIHSFFG
jgi:hypothetical protein